MTVAIPELVAQPQYCEGGGEATMPCMPVALDTAFEIEFESKELVIA